MKDCLHLFDTETAEWFQKTFKTPTAVQETAWSAIAAGGHVLVSAPTGTGKTLSAFLVFLDKLKRQAVEGTLKPELQLIYVSPLKSLAADIRENLRKPLTGIGGEELIKVAIRTGDTTQKERRQMIRKPPHILIITPESLYLMLTSKTGQNLLCTASALIIDELHALMDTKRGAHLMLSLARLDYLCQKPLQRIGLSATISNLSLAAEYLAPEPVQVIAPAMKKTVEIKILGSYMESRGHKKDPVWQKLSLLVYQHCQGNRSVIAFVEGRRYAEKLAYYVNLLGGEDFARVHHGSLSKEQRNETEKALREGRLRLLCATSSMELGIDVGEIDQVLQVGCPRTVSSTMQRLGRAGHNPSRTSIMYMFPRTAAECILCGMTAKLARKTDVEPMNPPKGCFDVLAQHLVSMSAFKSYEIDEVMKILPRAWSFRNVTKEDVKSILNMLAGDYEHKREISVRPRILYDRIHEKVEGDGYSRMLAVSAGGTIPDKGLYTVRTEEGVKVGEADEEFVYETQRGDRFILGAFAWKVLDIGKDTVTVTQAPVEGARLPFWKGEIKGRDKETGTLFGQILRKLTEAEEDGNLTEALLKLGLDKAASTLAAGYLKRQIKATGGMPDDRTIIIEHFKDQSGNYQLMVHSIFGRRINAPLSLLAAHTAREELNIEVGSVDEEDGFLLYSYGDKSLPEGLLYRIFPETSETILSALLPSTPLFNMAFRYNSSRALMMGVKINGRLPLWMQRLRSSEMLEQIVKDKEHPLIRETRQECMHQLWDVFGVKEILEKIQSGFIKVREIFSDIPSPMSLPLQWEQEAAVMYDYAPTPRGIHAAVEEALKQEKDLLQPGTHELAQVQARQKLPENEKQLHSLLMIEGDLAAGELDIPVEWLENLAKEERVIYLEQGLWIAAEHESDYNMVLETRVKENGYIIEKNITDIKNKHMQKTDTIEVTHIITSENQEKAMEIVRRMLRYRGASNVHQIAMRYGWQEEETFELLEELCRRNDIIKQATQSNIENKDTRKEILYYHAELYKRARTKTLKNRREEISTCPSASYAALLLSRIQYNAPAEECISSALSVLSGTSYPAAEWEELLLPNRVKNYQETLLDNVLSSGEYFWHMEYKGKIRFDSTEQIDWDTPLNIPFDNLSEKERLIAEALSKRGASFMQALNGILPGESPYDTLLSLLEKGIVCADSFVPVRQWLEKDKIKKTSAKRRVGAHVKALNAGRWDLVRPLKPLKIQEQMEQCFNKYFIMCRETALAYGIQWQEALSILRVQEYTGQVRRGYFIKGLSGTQFIRRNDFESITSFLQSPLDDMIWLNVSDPMQPWGKLFAHEQERSFINVKGTAAAFSKGLPVAIFEKYGNTLRTFETDAQYLKECLNMFSKEYKKGRIFAGRKRITVKTYPDIAVKALSDSGFIHEMSDYVLYR